MLRLNWQDNFKFPTQRLSQIMRDFGLRVICLIRLKIILPSLNLFLGANKSISVMKLRNKWFLAKLHSFIGVCKISYIYKTCSQHQKIATPTVSHKLAENWSTFQLGLRTFLSQHNPLHKGLGFSLFVHNINTNSKSKIFEQIFFVSYVGWEI